MRGAKKAARKSNANAATRSGRRREDLDFDPFYGTSSPPQNADPGKRGFTLADEARNTTVRGQSFWDRRLRDNKVNFVSAGTFKPEDAMAKMSLDSPTQTAEAEEPTGLEVEINEDILGVEADAEAEGEIEEEIEEEAEDPTIPKISTENATLDFMVDTQGSGSVETGIPPPRIRSSSPTPSDSSEEVILFAGRDAHGRGLSRKPETKPRIARVETDPFDSKLKIIDERIHQQEQFLDEVLQKTPPTHLPPPSKPSAINLSDPQSQGHRRSHRSRKDSFEDALMADYIANMQKEDDDDDNDAEASHSKAFLQRDLGGTKNEIWVETEASSPEPFRQTKRPFESNIYDLDDLSTSDGVMGEVKIILSKRQRARGVQYLVVWENQSVGEARWVPVTTLTSITALSHIEDFEAEEKVVPEVVDTDGDEEDEVSENMEREIDDDLNDDVDDEAHLVQRKINRMSDAQIAKLLAKQEELGMGSEQLLLFDDSADADADEEDGPTHLQGANSLCNPFAFDFQKSSRRASKQPRDGFPSATRMADAYDGFDVMDFDRPSLKKKPKGRKGKVVFDLSDSDLADSMQQAWDNDRLKKKERKQEREELRAQGLLGSKNGKVDLKAKYKEGMSMHAVAEEIKAFLMSPHTTLSLPPMDKASRKYTHTLANTFKLKSKSVGASNNRFPVLYKTARTSKIDSFMFDATQAKLTRRFLPRQDVGGASRSGGQRPNRGGGGFNNAAVSYKDGDIVGGSAPELGIENKGRAMLEKMGWSSGTALGALNNKGILQPVVHVVKTGKAGLG